MPNLPSLLMACVCVVSLPATALAQQSMFNVWSLSVDEQANRATVSVQIIPVSNQQTRVSYATYPLNARNGADYFGTSGTLTFPAGASTRTFSVDILNDTAVESVEKFGLRLYNPTGGAGLALATGTVTIVDNDGSEPAPISHSWLEDGSGGPLVGSGPTNSMGYPRVMMTETQAMSPSHSRFNKYPMLAATASNLWAVENVFKGQPPLYHRQFNPRQFMEWKFDDRKVTCSQGLSAPFEVSHSTTNLNNCQVWAGHFVYNNSSRLSAAMNAGDRTIRVANGSLFTVGKWVAIYDGQRTDFRNAEHAQITDISGNTITIGERYNSTPRSHPINAWVRQHEDGDYRDSGRYWVYNLSTACPRDAGGKRFVDHLVPWFVSNLKIDVDGIQRDVSVMGITFDVDTFVDVFTTNTRLSDVNNDGIPDGGIGSNGEHWWGHGVDEFYRMVRAQLPNYQIVGGVRQSFGFDTLDGIQIEGFPNGELWREDETYDRLNSMMSTYFYRMFRAPNRNRAQVQLLMKWGTSIYPTKTPKSTVSADRLAPMRLGLALTAMDGGVFHHENDPDENYLQDTWYDEYAVVVDRKAADYGNAVDKASVTRARQFTGWLGQPTSYGRRVVDSAAFSASNALLTQTFDSDANGWSGNNVNVYRTTTQKLRGNGGLAVSKMIKFDKNLYSPTVQGPSIRVNYDDVYTVTFAARADSDRWIQARLGEHVEDFLVGPSWRRYVMSFTANQSGDVNVGFSVGQINTQVFIDSVRVFRGSANVFRRYFQNGAVIANGTSKWVSVDLGPGYRRIRGTQAPGVNNGSDLPNKVNVPPYDAIFAVKK